MPRIIEIVLFLTPFVGFALWRLAFPSPTPPAWLVQGFAGVVVVMIAALLWLWQQDASDANARYIPAALDQHQVIPGHAAPVP